MDPSKTCLKGVSLFSQIKPELGKSKQSEYLYDYLSQQGAKTCVTEENYVDKDYLIDFAKFYSRSYNVEERHTIRFHFFSEEFKRDDLERCLNNCKDDLVAKLCSSYLGYIVRKPVKDAEGKYFIGKTLLKTYNRGINGDIREFLRDTHEISLFGIPLDVNTLPFQSQDQAVGGCATSACWVALHPLSTLFGTERRAPAEITEVSTFFPNLDRNFPSTGLTLYQMKSNFTSMGLETEFIDLEVISPTLQKYYKSNDDIISDAVKAYNRIGLPIIAALKLRETPTQHTPLYHAIVISGFRHHKGVVKELYIHDDQIGPFHHVYPIGGKFSQWNNDWIAKYGMNSVTPYKLLIPVYPKMRLSFSKIYLIYLKIKRETEQSIKDLGFKGEIQTEIFLIKLNAYKKVLWGEKFENKQVILCKPLPRFLWIIRTWYNGVPKKDILFDGTCVYPEELLQIKFQ
jgi:hypothetical protein